MLANICCLWRHSHRLGHAGPAGVNAVEERVVVVYPRVAAVFQSASGRVGGWGWCEQAEGAGSRDCLVATVRAELGEEVAYVVRIVCTDRDSSRVYLESVYRAPY